MKITKSALLIPALLGAGFLAQNAVSVNTPNTVQAAKTYQVKLVKNARVYTSKGKKTKTTYKKGKVLKAYRIKRIKGKYYYYLGKGKYIRTVNAKKYYYKKSTQTKKIVRIKRIKGKYYYYLGKGKYIRTSYAKKYYYKKSTQTKKIVRTLKFYYPTGTETVKQDAYVKRTVTTNLKTKRKSYGKWGKSSWSAYTTPTVAGYKASTPEVRRETVYSWTKNKTVKVTYKKNASSQSSNASRASNASNASTPSNNVTPSTPSSSNSSNASSSSSTPSAPKQEVKNTLTISDVNFNVKAKGDSYSPYLVKDNMITPPSWSGKMTDFKHFVYTVVKQGVDKKGEVYYLLRDDGVGELDVVWVKASEFEKTNEQNTADLATRFQWTDSQRDEFIQRHLANLNALRAQVGVAPLLLDTANQDLVNNRAVQKFDNYSHDGERVPYSAENLSMASNIEYNTTTDVPTTANFMNMMLDEFKYNWESERDGKRMYGDNGHYKNVINPNYTKVAIGVAYKYFPKESTGKSYNLRKLALVENYTK